MWLLNFLPNWFFYAVLLVGIVGLISTYFIRFLSFIPFIYVYKNPIQLISIALIAVGTFMSGAIHDNESWLARVKEMEEKVAAAEQESKKENVKIVTKVVKKLELVRTRGNDVIQYVDREVVKYDDKCVIPKEFVKAINDAAEPPK